MRTIYVASSWKNDHWLDQIHVELKAAGFNTFDFRSHGRWWTHTSVSDPVFGRCVTKPGQEAFGRDLQGMLESDAALVVLPAGMAVALEAGWFVGAGKPVVVWGEPREPLDITWLLAGESNLLCRRQLSQAIEALQEALA